MQKEERKMNEKTIDAALSALSANVPRATEASIERMLRSVRELSARRGNAAVSESSAVSEPQIHKAPPKAGKMTL